MSLNFKIRKLGTFEKINVGNIDDHIIEAEKKLDLNFSEEYREYLREFGRGDYNNHELTGLTEDKRLNIVIVTEEQRKLNPNIQKGFYVIEVPNIDSLVVWQNGKGNIIYSVDNKFKETKYNSILEYVEEN